MTEAPQTDAKAQTTGQNEETAPRDEINLLELVYVLAKRKRLIAGICSITALASLGCALLLPNIYSATAKVLPPQKESGGGIAALLGQAGGLAGLAAGGMGGGSDLYLGILKSRSVADAVVKRLDLATVYESKSAEEARKKFAEATKFQSGKDGIITITADDKDPKRAALLANTIVDELGRTNVRLNLSKAGTERIFLEKRLDVVKADLKRAEEDLKGFAQKNKVVQVDSQARASIEGVARLRAELASKEVQLAALRSYQTDENPEVKTTQAIIKKIKSELGSMAGSSVGETIPTIGSVPSVGLEYARKMRELKTQEAIFEQLTKQHEVAKLTEAKDSSTLQLLDEAVPPLKKSKPKRSLIVILATVTAFFLSVFLAFFLEYCEKMSEEDRLLFGRIKRQLRAVRE